MKTILSLLISMLFLHSCKDQSKQFTPTLQRPEVKEDKVGKYFEKEIDGTSKEKDEFSDFKKADESCSAGSDGKSKFGCSIK